MDVARPRAGFRHKRVLSLVGLVAAFLSLGFVWLARLERAAPRVDRSTLWIDRVRQADLYRETGGPGLLAAAQERLVVATQPALVEALPKLPGTRVEPGTVLVELSNPEIEYEALEAGRELRTALQELSDLRASSRMEVLSQEELLVRLEGELGEGERTLRAARELTEQRLMARMELDRRRDHVRDLRERIDLEERRTRVLKQSSGEQLAALREKVERSRQIVEFREQRVAELRVVAGMEGVLQELPLEIGQQVSPGTELARVARADRLKAILRIPESEAAEVRPDQLARVEVLNKAVDGSVSRVDPVVQTGTVTVEVELQEAPPPGARPEQSVTGRIQLEEIRGALVIGKPAFGRERSTVQLFVLDEDSVHASRRTVSLGGASVSEVAVLAGLREGERVILSDLPEHRDARRIRLD